tara:strand:- start:1065 stop:1700 length:636 start_codon:yes stop_codon:yes gene_type:complete
MTSILKADTIQDSSGNNIINESSDTITIGASGDTTNIVGTLQNNGSALIGGVTMAQQWRLSANFTCNGNDQTFTGWEAADQTGSVTIGSAMTESSGVFTFPETGIYEISQTAVFGSADYADTNVSVVMQLSTNSGGAYTNQSVLWIGYESGAGGNPPSRQTAHQSILMDVTNASTDRFRIRGSNADSTNAYFEGNSSANYTMVLFKRLGDT